MSALPALIHDGAVAAGIGTVLYTTTITTAALTALLARTPRRRRDARAVLNICCAVTPPTCPSDQCRGLRTSVHATSGIDSGVPGLGLRERYQALSIARLLVPKRGS